MSKISRGDFPSARRGSFFTITTDYYDANIDPCTEKYVVLNMKMSATLKVFNMRLYLKGHSKAHYS